MSKGRALPVLSTKLHPPQVPFDFVPRNLPLSVLDEGFTRPLTLVSAPAGFGKSSLAAHWCAGLETDFSWVSLDSGDDSLLGFGACIASALARLPQARGSEIGDLLQNRPSVQVEDLLASVVLSLERLQKRAVLVLDDFHVVHADDVCAFMDRLLSHPSHKLNILVIGSIVIGFAKTS